MKKLTPSHFGTLNCNLQSLSMVKKQSPGYYTLGSVHTGRIRIMLARKELLLNGVIFFYCCIHRFSKNCLIRFGIEPTK